MQSPGKTQEHDDEGKPKTSADFAAEALRKHYDSVFAQPIDSWKVTNTESDFSTEADEPCLQYICFSTADIEKACSELRGLAVKHVVGSCLVGSPGRQGGRELSAVVKIYPVTRYEIYRELC